jgi:hypothetical protein
MVSSGMLLRVALVRTDVSEELGASFIRVTRIGEPGKTHVRCEGIPIPSQRASVASCSLCCSWFTDSYHPGEGGARFLQNVGSYKSHTA